MSILEDMVMTVHIINAIALFAVYFLFTLSPCCRNKRGSLDIGKIIASKIPQHEIDALARCLLPAMNAFFETEEGRREFEEWIAAKTARERVTLERKAG
jgi:hypothetical protein